MIEDEKGKVLGHRTGWEKRAMQKRRSGLICGGNGQGTGTKAQVRPFSARTGRPWKGRSLYDCYTCIHSAKLLHAASRLEKARRAASDAYATCGSAVITTFTIGYLAWHTCCVRVEAHRSQA
jgi:hypothetical protein